MTGKPSRLVAEGERQDCFPGLADAVAMSQGRGVLGEGSP